MNLLYLCHRIPYPPDKGDKIRSFHQLEFLARRHRVHLATFVDAPEDRAHIRALGDRCASVVILNRGRVSTVLRAGVALLAGRSLSVAAFSSPALRRAVDGILKREAIDAALVYSSAMASYLMRSDVPRVIDFVDVDSEKWRSYAARSRGPARWVYAAEANRLARFDAAAAASAFASVFVSEAEAELFQLHARPRRTAVLPTGVDLDYFLPGSADPGEATKTRPGETDAQVLLFVGMMDYLPNIDAVTYFATEILPLVRSELPSVRFRIVGRNPTARVRALAKMPGVEVVGGVPDVRPYLSTAAISVAPFRISRGLQSKVLEAMATGLPVVGTPLAFQGIGAGAADGVFSVPDARAMAPAIAALLTNREERAAAGAAARRYVERHHRWETHQQAIESLLAEAAR